MGEGMAGTTRKNAEIKKEIRREESRGEHEGNERIKQENDEEVKENAGRK